MALISEDLFKNFLIAPIENGADEIFIVSGYATSRMAVRHLEVAKELLRVQRYPIKINLIVGMCPRDGLATENHAGLVALQTSLPGSFECHYKIGDPVHSKVYSWSKEQTLTEGFVGSANYTQSAFSPALKEVLTSHDALECKQYFDHILGDSISCLDEDAVRDSIYLYEDRERPGGSVRGVVTDADEALEVEVPQCVTLTLLNSDNNVDTPERSGINWGQRSGRNPNQAYIAVPQPIRDSDFFPPRRQPFTVLTDDGKSIICVRAQSNAKAIQSTLNNSLLGAYLRYRLGVPDGAFVTASDLIKYGRTDVTFCKVDDENYLLDFSV